MLNVFDIFILALGNWLQCCSLKSWAGISIRELKTLRNNLWSAEKQSHYNQEVLIFFKVQQENELQAGSQKSSLQSQCFSKASPSQVPPGRMTTGWTDGWMDVAVLGYRLAGRHASRYPLEIACSTRVFLGGGIPHDCLRFPSSSNLFFQPCWFWSFSHKKVFE